MPIAPQGGGGGAGMGLASLCQLHSIQQYIMTRSQGRGGGVQQGSPTPLKYRP